jgi:probable phosphoglycerate mutase
MKTKTTFLLIRHGEAEQNVLNVLSSLPESRERHLTARGREQILVLAEQLRKNIEPIAIIFHSPLVRTRETAEILAEKTGAPLREDARLRETDFGVFNGRDTKLFHEKYPRKTARLATDGVDGVEGFSHEWERAADFCRDVSREYSGRSVVVVSHADTIQVLYGFLNQLSFEETFSRTHGFCPNVGEMMRVEVEEE